MKSSSDMVPTFIILTAVSIDPRHFARRTTPNWPDPSSSRIISSDGWISHLSKAELWLTNATIRNVFGYHEKAQRLVEQDGRMETLSSDKPSHQSYGDGSWSSQELSRSNVSHWDKIHRVRSAWCDNASHVTVVLWCEARVCRDLLWMTCERRNNLPCHFVSVGIRPAGVTVKDKSSFV